MRDRASLGLVAAACQRHSNMAAALLQCDAEVVYGHAGGSAYRSWRGCEGAIETIAHLTLKSAVADHMLVVKMTQSMGRYRFLRFSCGKDLLAHRRERRT